eukprot:763064-Hanusia_phi.AAC.2
MSTGQHQQNSASTGEVANGQALTLPPPLFPGSSGNGLIPSCATIIPPTRLLPHPHPKQAAVEVCCHVPGPDKVIVNVPEVLDSAERRRGVQIALSLSHHQDRAPTRSLLSLSPTSATLLRHCSQRSRTCSIGSAGGDETGERGGQVFGGDGGAGGGRRKGRRRRRGEEEEEED